MGFQKKKSTTISATKKSIAVIGGGSGGMCMVAALKEEGHEPECFELTNQIGGTWCYREEPIVGVGSLMLHTTPNHSKEIGAFSDFPPRKEYNNYMKHEEVHQYFLEYWTQKDCLKHLRLNMKTTEVKRSHDYDSTGRWEVTVQHTVTGEVTRKTYDGVVVCVGHINRPKMPTFPGQEHFKGKIIHTHSLKDNLVYKGKNVVVVGTNCSGLDAAADISNNANQVYLSARSGSFIMPRMDQHGKPLDSILITRFFAVNLKLWPRSCANFFLEKFYLDKKFHRSLYAVPPQVKYLSKSPVVNDAIFVKLMAGTVIQKRTVNHFVENGVVFDGDDHVTEVDDVVMATGYTWGFPFLEEGVVVKEERKFHLYKYVYPPHLKHPTLAVLGFMFPLGPGFPVSEIQARWISQIFSGKCHLPSRKEMDKDIERKYQKCLRTFQSDDKMMLRSDYVEAMDEVAKQFGVKPNFYKLFFTDPKLYWKAMFGPFLAYQYRLKGPHKWPGARKAILTSENRFLYPLQRNQQKDNTEDKGEDVYN